MVRCGNDSETESAKFRKRLSLKKTSINTNVMERPSRYTSKHCTACSLMVLLVFTHNKCELWLMGTLL